MLAAKHLLGLGGFDLLFERLERAFEVSRDVLAALRPFKQDTEVVNLLGEVVPQLEVFSEAPLTLQCLLGLRLVVPEIRGGDLLFELR